MSFSAHSSIHLLNTLTQSSRSFTQGITCNFLPPLSSKSSAASIPISSNVSRQSEIKAGVAIANSFVPFLAKASTVLSVDGFNQDPKIDTRDWKLVEYVPSLNSKYSATFLVVISH